MIDEDRREVCLNCVGFRFKQGATNTRATQQGECRASIPKAGGTKWANVKGDDWCRDGFKPTPAVKAEIMREAKAKKARGSDAGSEGSD